jgi:hypothetical protein
VVLPAAIASRPRRLALHLGTVLARPGREERHVPVTLGCGAGALPPIALRDEGMRWHLSDLPPSPAECGTLPASIACGRVRSLVELGRGDDPRTLGVSLSTILLPA